MTTAAIDELRIRAASVADLDTVVTLRIALLAEYHDHPVYGRLRPDARVRARSFYRRQLESTTESIFLAERGGRAIAVLRCVDSHGTPMLDPARYCYISSVYVIPEERGHGVLRRLMQVAEGWCDARGLTEIRLHNSALHADAVAVWDAMGFEVVEQVRRRQLR